MASTNKPSVKGLAEVARHHFGLSESDIRSRVAEAPAGVISPTVIEERQMNMTAIDIFSRLIMDRIIFLGDSIDETVANIVMSQMLYLDSTGKSDISIYINSPGGSIYDGNGILDVMDFVKCDVTTICTGLAASMASVILSNGAKGKRYALPRSRVMIHQASMSKGWSTFADFKIAVDEMRRTQDETFRTLAANTGKSMDEIERLCDRDHWYDAREAKEELGIIDEILYQR